MLNDKLNSKVTARTQELQQTVSQLEQRTAELSRANALLQQEITERERIEERLYYDASHDGLTGLKNRPLFMTQLRQAIERAKRHKGYLFAVLFMDIDRFKHYHDIYGHMEGDDCLRVIAEIIV